MTVLLLGLVAPATAGIYPVTSEDGDSSEVGTLRWAIESANANPSSELDVISFSFSGKPPFVIEPASALPDITGPVTIDGFTQGGEGVFDVVLSGASSSAQAGLLIRAGGVEIRGLSIVAWSNGIELVSLDGFEDHVVVSGNLIGLWPDLLPDGNRIGVHVNCIGFDVRVGGLGEFDGNVISANDVGLSITPTGPCPQNPVDVLANRIGTDPSGASGVGNGEGVYVGWSVGVDNPVRIGDGSMAGSNTIAFNAESGVRVAPLRSGVSILYNSIHSNGKLGIDLDEESGEGITENDPSPDEDEGGNSLQNFPTLSDAPVEGLGATGLQVELESADGDYIIEIYSNPAPDNWPDGSGGHGFHGEGKEWLLSIDPATVTGGLFTTVLPIPISNAYLSATATNKATGDTSEFSAWWAHFTRDEIPAECTAGAIQASLDTCAATPDGEICRFRFPEGCLGVETDQEVVVGPRTFLDGQTSEGGRFHWNCPSCTTALRLTGGQTHVRRLWLSADTSFSDVVANDGALEDVLLDDLLISPCDGGPSLGSVDRFGYGNSEHDGCTFLGNFFEGSRNGNIVNNTYSGDVGLGAYNVENFRFWWNLCSGAGCVQVAELGAGSLAAGGGARSLGVSIRRNDIATVDDVPVDLQPIGPTPNDPGDSDDGPNRLQNYPVVASAVIVGDELRVTVELDSEADGAFEIDLMADSFCGASGRGGGTYFGSTTVATDSSGIGSALATFELPLAGVKSLDFVTGIATSEEGNSSEVGTCTAVTELPPDIFADDFESGDTSAWSSTQPPP